MKHKYHLPGIGGKPSKQMKELQNKPLPMILFKKPPDYPKNEKEFNKRISKVKSLCKLNLISQNPSKNA